MMAGPSKIRRIVGASTPPARTVITGVFAFLARHGWQPHEQVEPVPNAGLGHDLRRPVAARYAPVREGDDADPIVGPLGASAGCQAGRRPTSRAASIDPLQEPDTPAGALDGEISSDPAQGPVVIGAVSSNPGEPCNPTATPPDEDHQ